MAPTVSNAWSMASPTAKCFEMHILHLIFHQQMLPEWYTLPISTYVRSHLLNAAPSLSQLVGLTVASWTMYLSLLNLHQQLLPERYTLSCLNSHLLDSVPFPFLIYVSSCLLNAIPFHFFNTIPLYTLPFLQCYTIPFLQFTSTIHPFSCLLNAVPSPFWAYVGSYRHDLYTPFLLNLCQQLSHPSPSQLMLVVAPWMLYPSPSQLMLAVSP